MVQQKILSVIIASLGLARPCLADGPLRPWESSGLWAPAAGLSYADTAIADQPETVFSNMAGLAQFQAPSLRYSHRPFSLEPNYDGLAFVQPMGPGAFGVGFEATRNGNGGSYDAVAGAAFKSGGTSFGFGLRSGGSDLNFKGADQTYASDLGFLWKAPQGKFQVGSSVLRLPLNQGPLNSPHLLALGASYAFSLLRLSVEGKLSAGEHSFHGGIEAPLFDLLDLRLGVSSLGYQGAAAGVSGGLGLHYGKDLSFDYAAYPTPYSGVLHSLSIGYSFSRGWGGWTDDKAREDHEKLTADKAWRQERERYAKAQSSSAQVDEGDFELNANVAGRKVILEWQAPAGEGLSYVVTQGMLPMAKFRSLNERPQEKSSWTGEMSLRGVTYYFRVLSTRPDGSAGPVSKVKAVQIP
jgi:hypothetical protein